LFAGIGGFETGLNRAGFRTDALCEIDPAARTVLRTRFPGVPLIDDVREFDHFAETDVLALGFPCQDLSQAGRVAGIRGASSGIVTHVLDALGRSPIKPKWVLVENVPFMLHLEKGQAIAHLVARLESMGYHWAYRVVDTRAFGLPQRRRRVVLLASLENHPRNALFGSAVVTTVPAEPKSYGFYWTEGNRGLGWAPDAVPTLKGGSGVGIPSPPAVWLPDRDFAGLIHIEDAERLQGFEPGWTQAATGEGRASARWKLVGNAVAVPVAEWLGRRIRHPDEYDPAFDAPMPTRRGWPSAAWGSPGIEPRQVETTEFPVRTTVTPLHAFLRHELSPLSARATRGFLSRITRSRLRRDPAFVPSLERHLRSIEKNAG
jgi:DNA (cytosine-5)-methyltransferase 1